MNGLTVTPLEPNYSEFVEVDPTGRYGRYNEVLGKGASKTVYRAFDEYEGIEVAWNQVKLYDFMQSPEDLERLYCEIHLLKTLKHKNIMKFYTSWVDSANRNINFVTEMFTSGTLRQYRQKHKNVNIRAVKHWCRQILKGLLYLHNHDPPVIHRDLKCDNIFVNGHQGEVKIGDLGLAAILRKSHAAHCVGTPEFMAPEVYEEEYNELVDIYSFGMCILEMVTFDYPYSECNHPAQIYKKVISGKKPEALYQVKDPEVRNFVEKCLVTVSLRLSAKDLLKDPFLQIDDCGPDLRPLECRRESDYVNPLLRQHLFEPHHSNDFLINGYSGDLGFNSDNKWEYHPVEIENGGIELFAYNDDEHSANVDITIKGRRREDDSISLRLRIADNEGRIRNIYFPFDIETDTALNVATEMVSELDMTNQDVNKIADIIDREIASLVPERKLSGSGVEETPCFATANFCHNCASDGSSNGSVMDYLSTNPDAKNLQLLQCCRHGCGGAMHGRFEEITYQVDGSEHSVTENAPVVSSQSDGLQYADIWARLNDPQLSSEGSPASCLSLKENEPLDQSDLAKDERVICMDNQTEPNARNSVPSSPCGFSDDYENEIRQDLRWLKAKYHMELRDLRNQHSIIASKALNLSPLSGNRKQNHEKSFPKSETAQHRKVADESYSPESMVTAKSFFAGTLLPSSIYRTTSLPVDAVEF